MDATDFTLPLDSGYSFHLRWAQHLDQYISPFDGHPYILSGAMKEFRPTERSKRFHTSQGQARETSHVQLKNTVFIDNPTPVDGGCSGAELAVYVSALEQVLLSIIPNGEAGGHNCQGKQLILQVDLQPGRRQWLELCVFPDSGTLDVEAILEKLDVIRPPDVFIRVRFHIYFSLWGYKGHGVSATKEGYRRITDS